MDVIQTLKVKNLNGTFEQTIPIGTSSVYVFRKDKSGQIIETAENALQEIENDIATINGPVSIQGSVAYKIDQLHKTILNNETAYKTLKSVGDRLRFLESSETGSIKNQIAKAKSEILGGAGADYDTLKEIQGLFEKLKIGEKDAFDTLGEIATGIENNKKAIESNDTDIANLNNKINTSITNLIDNAGEGYKTLGDIETSVKSINSTINGQISDLDSNISTLNSAINNRIDGVEQNLNTLSNEIDTLEEKINNTTNSALESKINNVESMVKFDSTSEINDDITISLSKIGCTIQINISGILNAARSNFFFDTIGTKDLGLLSSKTLSKYILVAPSYFGKLELYENGHFFLGGFTDLNGNLVELPAMTEIAITESFMLDRQVIIIEGGVEEVNPVGVGG